ncbi:hypothetical protein [Dyadobacter sp. CY312]|uniref:hypothetical protein n=1 Tax=Dyadobacter sp. CY312 TaxID=2907303 RepID=UPI001F2C97A6|nr:hypothetical protein [Dyadobacter sp. CY312]MCE7041716.1 hypothetical protein [Dyadobacter sp. CY312]
MKKLATIFVFAFALSTTISFGNNADEKATVSSVKSLPASLPAIETPAPQRTKPTAAQKYSPAQKAAITELKLSSVSK